MVGNLNYLAEHGYDCYCICNRNNELTPELLGKVNYIPMDIKWGYMSLKDFVSCTYNMYKRSSISFSMLHLMLVYVLV